MKLFTKLSAASVLFLSLAGTAFAFQSQLIYLLKGGDVKIADPTVLQYFYDDLQGVPRDYAFTSPGNSHLDLKILVPLNSNPDGRYSAKISSIQNNQPQQLYLMDGALATWTTTYDPMIRDYSLAGPELSVGIPAGSYQIEIFSADNKGKYILQVSGKDVSTPSSIANFFWQTPLLKLQFFSTPIAQFFVTPFFLGLVACLGALIILLLFLRFLYALIKESITKKMAKTLLLTSSGMDMREEILKLLQKPTYDVTVAFIDTASKPAADKSYVAKDFAIMKDMGFNVEVIDIEGKTQSQLMQLLQLKDIIFVEGGNTFYLLAAMRKCGFERIIRKLLKKGIVYIGCSAGSIVTGKSIETTAILGTNPDENIVGLKNLKGMNLVPFNIFVHYHPEDDEIIKKYIKSPRKRQKRLRILADGQAVLVQGSESFLIGKGEQIIV